MSVELTMLTWSAILAFVMAIIPATKRVLQYGLPAGVGNRDNLMPLDGWAARAQRASANMFESLPVFAVLVLVVHVTGAGNDVTILGAQLFFWSRVAFAAVYYAGVPWLRTGVWLVAVAGMAMVASALF